MRSPTRRSGPSASRSPAPARSRETADPVGGSSIDPVQRRLAERRLITALRKLHRREPLSQDVRLDALLEAARAEAPAVSRRHRGGGRLVLDDRSLAAVVDQLAASGKLVRSGRRVRLPEHRPTLDPELRARVDRLIDGLVEAGAAPPRVDGVAARLGIPPAVIGQLRAAGELVPAGEGIDYPRRSWERLRVRLDQVARRGPLTVARVRDALHTSRRHAEALLSLRRAERQRARAGSRRRGGGAPPLRTPQT